MGLKEEVMSILLWAQGIFHSKYTWFLARLQTFIYLYLNSSVTEAKGHFYLPKPKCQQQAFSILLFSNQHAEDKTQCSKTFSTEILNEGIQSIQNMLIPGLFTHRNRKDNVSGIKTCVQIIQSRNPHGIIVMILEDLAWEVGHIGS